MRIAMYYNPSAGGRVYSSALLGSLLRDAGHQVSVHEKAKGGRGVAAALESRPDVVVAAGGDGTVAEAAIALAGRAPQIPLYVLPVGTSNNVAETLAMRDTVPVLVQKLAGARSVPFDVGTALSPAGSDATRFVEGAGTGFFGDTLSRSKSRRGRLLSVIRSVRRRRLSGEAEVHAAARGMARVIRSFETRTYTVIADGEDLSGAYAAVEVMNIRSIGPRIWIAPEADPGDGWLDLVLIRAEDREPLARLCESVEKTRTTIGISRRVREAQISWKRGEGHVDDNVWDGSARAGRAANASLRITADRQISMLVPN